MSFDNKPIGIGNLATNLKRAQKDPPAIQNLKKVPDEIAENEDGEVAQLAVDVRETNDNLIIVAPLAGVAPDDVRVEITEDVVTIEGERQQPLLESSDDEYLVQECFFGPFSRSIVLPEAVNSKKARAEFKKSVLVLTIPKLDNVRTRVVKIQPSE
ncbi:MAG: Hsp20/alpha crystallin family protein [Candidatus Peribacteraceae bacterium]|nr:Hsp20/alpha crystallin family protein [Candidatus Peribacteraceae bacterium]